MDSLKNQVVMISGGSKGIGYATALRLGLAGAKISICARGNESLQKALSQLQEQGVDAMAGQADITEESDIERWFSATEKQFGPATVLVNNAGISGYGNITELTEEQFDQTIRVNLRGVFLCTRRVIPGMIQAKQGKIIFLSSIASKYFRHGHSLYFASKWALNGFALSVAKELNPHHVHAHILCPGMTETNFFDATGGRLHADDVYYMEPGLIAEQIEHLCLLPDSVDTLDFALFPSWQQHSLGVRR